MLFAGGDETGVREVLTPDVAWHVPGDNAIAGDYHGIEEVVVYFRRRRDLANSTFTMTPRDLLVGEGDHVTALTDGTATIDGERHTWSTAGLYHLRGAGSPRAGCCRSIRSRSTPSGAAADRPGHRVPSRPFRTTVRPRHTDAQGALHPSRYYGYFEDAFLQARWRKIWSTNPLSSG